jgi:hypothetical protein
LEKLLGFVLAFVFLAVYLGIKTQSGTEPILASSEWRALHVICD